MKRYIFAASVVVMLGIFLSTNPNRMSAPSLLLCLAAITLCLYQVVSLALRRAVGDRASLKQLGGRLRYRTTLTAGMVVLFLFFLNSTGALTFRDVVLAVILANIANFYLSKQKLVGTE